MRYLKILSLGVMVILGALALAVPVTSSAAITLPDIHVLSGELYPLHLNFSDNKPTPTKLSNAGGSKLQGTGTLLLFLTFELSSQGSFEALFLKVTEPKEKSECNTSGDKAGEILVKGSFRVVPLNTTGSELADLYLAKEITIECNKGMKHIESRGDALTSINLGTTKESEDSTESCGVAGGNGKGKPELTEYINDSGAKVKVEIEFEFGAGFSESAVEVEEVCAEALQGKMFSILDR